MLAFYLSVIPDEEEKNKFTALYRRYKQLMLKTAFGLLQDAQLTEDAVQDAFLYVAKHMEKIDAPESPRTVSFLLLVTRCCAVKVYHKRREIPMEAETLALRTPPEEDPVLNAENAEAVKRAIAALPDALRRPLLLKFAHGLKYAEIAAVTGLSVDACKKRVERAKRALKESLKNFE